MSKLEDFLEQNNSKDVNADVKMINRITSEKNKKILERMVKNITGNCSIILTMGLFHGSYATINKNQIVINIDPMLAYEPNDSFEKLWVKCQGMLAHEAGHILYSDFKIVAENQKQELECKSKIPIIGNKIAQDDFDAESDCGKAIMQELYECIYGYIYYKKLASMLNSIEDAAVEHHTPAYAPRTYGGIIAMRNSIFEKEKEIALKKIGCYKAEDADEIEYFITEMRHYSVIGYRKNITPVFLPIILTTNQIEEVENLGLYGRICSKNTEERNAIAMVLLDMLNPLIEEKAKKFMEQYLENLSMSTDELASMMDMELDGHTEMVCQGAMDPSLAGKTKPQNITSDYQMDLPQQTIDKINDKMKERQAQNNDSGSDNSSQSSGANGSNEKSENGAEANKEEQDSGKSNENGQDGVDESSSQNQNLSEPCNEESESGEKEGEVQSSINGGNSDKKFNKDKAALEADAAYQDSLKKAEKAFEKETATDFKQSLNANGNGIAPKLENNFGDVNNISDLHKGVKTCYTPSVQISGVSSSGTLIDKTALHKQASTFSKKLKEVLMYQAKTRRKNGLKNGDINDAALSRIITDQRVFRKTINGIEKKARLAVLMDLSGSMCGEKIIDAIAASYMLAEACSKIKVPISIMGHNTGWSDVNLYHFVEFENYLKKESKDKILAAEAGGANHDGLAIFHAATDLVRHRKPKEQLVLMVISDGAPAGVNNYYGEIADKDIQKITNAFEKQYQVKTIGIGIGNDVEHVPNIYKNFLLVPNVEKLGTELLKVLKSLLIR